MRNITLFCAAGLVAWSSALPARAAEAWSCRILLSCSGDASLTPRDPRAADPGLPLLRQQKCMRMSDMELSASLTLAGRDRGAAALLTITTREIPMTVLGHDGNGVNMSLVDPDDRSATPAIAGLARLSPQNQRLTLVALNPSGFETMEFDCEEIG